MASVIMVIGGSRSGKSRFAEKLAQEQQELTKTNQFNSQYSSSSVTYIATGKILDEDFSERVKKHQDRRPTNWVTVEEPIDLHKALEQLHQLAQESPVNTLNQELTQTSSQHTIDSRSVVIIDGIGTWIANLMYKDWGLENHSVDEYSDGKFHWNTDKEKELLQSIELFIEVTKKFTGTIIIVADEVGMDVIPEHREARIFRDLNGFANQTVAEHADQVYLVVCGLPLVIKGNIHSSQSASLE